MERRASVVGQVDPDRNRPGLARGQCDERDQDLHGPPGSAAGQGVDPGHFRARLREGALGADRPENSFGGTSVRSPKARRAVPRRRVLRGVVLEPGSRAVCSPRDQGQPLCNHGFTLIETMIAVSIVGVLVALLLPAVQSAREAARRAQCASNLKQIGLALSAYHASYDRFPYDFPYLAGTPGASQSWPKAERDQYCSAIVHILPYLDQAPLFAAVNFCFETHAISYPAIHPANVAAAGTSIDILLCPSDGLSLPRNGTNYRGNYGIGPQPMQNAEGPDSGNGFLTFPSCLSASSFVDGLSTTVAFSERLIGSGQFTPQDAERNLGDLDAVPYGSMNTADYALMACNRASQLNFPRFVDAGYTWFLSGRTYTSYCHAQQPNGSIPDCVSEGMAGYGHFGITTARSHHRGGVNASLVDGSVRFVAETIQRPVCALFGTRNGGEIVD